MDHFFSSLINALGELATTVGLRLLYALLLLIIGLKLTKLLCKKLKNKHFGHVEEGVGKYLLSVLQVVLNLLVFITAALVLGVPATSFITILGSAGLAIGLALQGSLSNLAGSIMLMLFKPYKVGDYVEVSGVSGTVDEINLFYTVLNTPDNKRITVPNGAASNAVIVDYSAQETRRVDLEFGVAYGTDVSAMRDLLLQTAAAHPAVLADPAPVAYLTKEDDSALVFVLRTWCANGDYWKVHFDLMENVHNAIVAAGIEIPFPQMDVHMR